MTEPSHVRRRSSARDRAWPAMQAGGESFGPYRLLEKVGDGGFAEVFLAEPRGGGETVVVKRLHKHLEAHHESVEMFLTEARVMAELAHPHIVQIEHFDQIQGRWSIVMERVDGADLAFVFDLAQDLEVTLPVAGAVRIIAECAEALHYAHEVEVEGSGQALGVIHRDIKPDNILVTWSGDAKVIDFGCAKAAVQSELTRPGIRKGTLDYMSPEQCLGRQLDRRTDIFSLGVVLYELVTMTRLYADESDARVMERIAHEITRPPSWANPEINAPLDLIVLRALEKRADDRFDNAGELARALRWWLARYGKEEPATAWRDWMKEHVRGQVAHFRTTSVPSGHGELAIRPPSDVVLSDEEVHAAAEAALATPGGPQRDRRSRADRSGALDAGRLEAIQSIVAGRSNLPAAERPLIGRQAELATIEERFAAGHRVVSLHGVTGVGKSHLAEAYARSLLKSRGTRLGGVWWVDATHVKEVAGLPMLLAEVLELPASDALTQVREVGEALQIRGPTTIVIDALDRVRGDVVPLLRHWVEVAVELEILVTAQEPLVDTSQVAVSPLSTPRDPRMVAQSDAGRIFVLGVRRKHPDFSVHPGIATQLCELLRELGGISATILMAAGTLSDGDPDAELRRRGVNTPVAGQGAGLDETTLASAVVWSWQQLDEDERVCLGAATVFHGGFDREAAGAVIGPLVGGDLNPALDRLVERSLVTAWEPVEAPGTVRFKVVRAIRTHAREQLVAGPHSRAARRAHAVHFLAQAERFAVGCHGPNGPDAVRAMRLEMRNIHAVMQRAMRVKPATSSSATRVLEVAVHLWAYADVRGRHANYLDLLGRALDATRKAEVPVLLKTRALLRMCRAAVECDDLQRAKQAVEMAQRAAHAVDDPAVIGRIAQASGELCVRRQDFHDAREFLQIAVSQLTDAQASREEARAYLYLGISILGDARLETAESCMLTARERFVAAGALHGEATALAELGALYDRLERAEEASELLRRAVSIFRAFGDRRRHAETLLSLARLSRGEGDFDAARSCCVEAEALAAQHGDEALRARAAQEMQGLDGAGGGSRMPRRDSWVVAAGEPRS